jgi:hypothetical protein
MADLPPTPHSSPPLAITVAPDSRVLFLDVGHVRALGPLVAANSNLAQNATVGATVVPPSVQLTDLFGQPVPGITVTFAVGSGGGSVTGATTVTNASGIATVGSWTLGHSPGSNTLTATAPGFIGSPLTFTASAAPGSPAAIARNAGNNQTTTAGTAVAVPPSVFVSDAFGNPVPGVPVTSAVLVGGGSVTGASAVTGANGIATVGSWTLGTAAGNNLLTASVAGLPNPATFSASAVPGASARLAFATQPSTTVPGQLITPAVTVAVEDQYGNVVSTDSSLVSIDLGNNPGATNLGGNRAVQAVNGRATFNALFLTALGSGYTLLPSDGVLQRTPSQPFDVNLATLTPSTTLALTNQPVTFTFRTLSLVPAGGGPFGTVTFSLGGTVLGTAPVNSDGLANFTTALPPSPASGPNVLTARYNDSGSGTNPNSASTAVTVLTTTGAGVPAAIVLGPGSSGSTAVLPDGVPAGVVAGTLRTNSPASGTFVPANYTLVPGFGDDNLFYIVPGSSPETAVLVANFPTAFDSRRSYTVQVSSDSGQGTPVSAVFTLFVAPSSPSSPTRTTTTLTPSGSGTPGQSTSFSVTVSSHQGTPTGSVLLLVDGTPMGVQPLQNGSSTFTNVTLASGQHSLAAVYTGDGTFNASTSTSLNIGPGGSTNHPQFEIGVYDPQSSSFYLRNEKSSGSPDAGTLPMYGLQNWKPVTGDFTGTHKTTIGIVDPSGARDTVNHRDAFWFLGSANGVNDIPAFAYGYASWTPIAGDWTGSGRYGIGAYDPATATFYLRNETSAGAPDAGVFQFGAAGWIPLAGDWTGSGKFGIGVFDPTTATFYLRNELSGGAADAGVIQFGLANWKPVVGDWNGDGKWTIGVVDPSGARDTVNHRDAYWFLSDDNKTVSYTPFAYGYAAWTPLAGVWNPPAGTPMAATGVAGSGAGPLLDVWAVAQLARAQVRHSDALDSLFASGL